MASSTPPHCSITTSKPYQNHHYQKNHRQNYGKVSLTKPSHNSTTSSAAGAAVSAAAAVTNPISRNPSFPTLPPPSSKSELTADFSGRRSTRFVSKMHFGRPNAQLSSRHSSVAEDALQELIRVNGGDDKAFESVLLGFASKMCGSDDYTFLLRELGNRNECSKAVKCFEFAVARERRKNEQGKLTSSMISILGRLGKVDLAKNVFETAIKGRYGKTVYAFSALISAYGRSGWSDEALRVFDSMKEHGLKPNLVTYNAVIDACGKGGVDYNRATGIFHEMLRNGLLPDRITYNSLLAVCSRGGMWEAAQSLFSEMVDRGVYQDIFTYNTLLDALCKGGQLDLAYRVMSEMPAKRIPPNVVTYSTLIDGYAKAGKLNEALSLLDEMKFMGIGLDRVSYNNWLSIYAKLGRFEEVVNVCNEMESAGIKKDVVTYNALLSGYGKQANYEKVKRAFEEMKAERIYPNLLTYSILIDNYSKANLYKEAVEVFREFKQTRLKADVVLYSAAIDALCKNGLVKAAVSLLDEMTKEGITPNVVTYNSIIDAFGRSAIQERPAENVDEPNTSVIMSSSVFTLENAAETDRVRRGDNQLIKMFGKLAVEKTCQSEKGNTGQEILCILGVLYKMHELDIKPNVVTFSAILNACSRCNSFEDASTLLEKLQLFDNQVYGVAHGLLMGHRGHIWGQAQSLFDEVKLMDSSTASAFYNALTDMLWHFGQKQGAQLVVLEGQRRQVWENMWSDSCLDLHLMSSGAARAMVHAWLLDIRSIVFEGHTLPKLISILTGWGKHSKVLGDGALRRAVEALLAGMGAPFRAANCNLGRFVSTGSVVASWLRESGTLKVLVLRDDRMYPETARSQVCKLLHCNTK